MSQKQIEVSLWETTLYKLLPLIFTIVLIFIYIPEISFIPESAIPQIFLTTMYAWLGAASLIELGKSLPDGLTRYHFGIPLLAVLAAVGFGLAINAWFSFYDAGDNRTLVVLFSLWLFIEFLLLFWQNRSEFFKRKRLRLKLVQMTRG